MILSMSFLTFNPKFRPSSTKLYYPFSSAVKGQ